jgi:NadR type nicotinamide-nucleotide adenylyltransferase
MTPLKVVVIGPECTGKSTLSIALAQALHTVWVKEYAREYLTRIERPYSEEDLLHIARGQVKSEETLLPFANKYLICDTDLNVVKVWSEAKYGRCHRSILETIAERRYDLYLLADIDIPWTSDPQREHPAQRDRTYFYRQYQDIVQQSGLPWANISGTESQRLDTALRALSLINP